VYLFSKTWWPLIRQPAGSVYQRIEDWFLSVLPIDGEM
jgi:hypothetical protein